MANWKSSGDLKTVRLGPEAFAPTDQILVAWLSAAGLLLNIRGTIVMIDPLLMQGSEPGTGEIGLELAVDLPILANEVPRVDYVLYTHGDGDHMGIKTAWELSKKGAVFVGTYASYYKLTQNGIPPEQCRVCRYEDPFPLGEITLSITPCDHPWQLKDRKRGGPPFRYGDCCGYIFNTPEGRLFFPGDTRLMEEHLRIRDIHLLALDVSLDENHLTHRYAAVLANNLPDAWLLPLHYGTFVTDNPAHVGEPADAYAMIFDSEQRGLTLNPGELFRFRKRV